MQLPGVFAVVGALALIIALLLGLRPSARQRWSARWIRDQEAVITPDLRREVEDVRWRQRTGGLVGALVGLMVVIPISLRFDPTDDESALPTLAVMFVPFVLIFVGEGVSGLIGAMREISGPIRVASSRAPRLSDFVSRAGLVAMRAQMVVLIGGSLAATQLASWTGVAFSARQAGFLWGSVIVMTIIWLMSELVARRLVVLPLPSADATTLFWRTALRGERLREICRLPACIGYAAPAVISEALPRFYGTPAMHLGPDLVFAFSLLVLGLSVAGQLLLLRTPRSHGRQPTLLTSPHPYEQA